MKLEFLNVTNIHEPWQIFTNTMINSKQWQMRLPSINEHAILKVACLSRAHVSQNERIMESCSPLHPSLATILSMMLSSLTWRMFFQELDSGGRVSGSAGPVPKFLTPKLARPGWEGGGLKTNLCWDPPPSVHHPRVSNTLSPRVLLAGQELCVSWEQVAVVLCGVLQNMTPCRGGWECWWKLEITGAASERVNSDFLTGVRRNTVGPEVVFERTGPGTQINDVDAKIGPNTQQLAKAKKWLQNGR